MRGLWAAWAAWTALGTVPDGFEAKKQAVDRLRQQLNVVDTRIDAAAEKVYLLREAALGGVISQSRAQILHKNEMGRQFVLERAEYRLDGKKILDRGESEGEATLSDEMELYRGAIKPGPHEVSVSLVFRGASFGFITYMEGYRFRVKSKCSLNAVDGRLNRLEVVIHRAKDLTARTSDQFKVRCDVALVDETVPDDAELAE